MTKKELAEKMIPVEFHNKFDYALPQNWVDEAQALAEFVHVASHFVWLYDTRGGIFGRPFPLTVDGANLISVFNETHKTCFPTDQKVY